MQPDQTVAGFPNGTTVAVGEVMINGHVTVNIVIPQANRVLRGLRLDGVAFAVDGVLAPIGESRTLPPMITSVGVTEDGAIVHVVSHLIHADVPNGQGEIYPRGELEELASRWVRGGTTPCFASLGRVHDTESACGLVTGLWMGADSLMCSVSVDAGACPDLARGLTDGLVNDMSFRVGISGVECSLCGRTAPHFWETPEGCDHLS